MMVWKFIFILFLFFVSCSGEEKESSEVLYDFPPLSQGQLIDLKKQSEKTEGFFVTTDLSDLDHAWTDRGFYLYVCIRFLNDQTVNDKLKKSAIPLLVQVSSHKDKPEAESLLLFHPKTIKPDKTGIFYYEERQSFEFTDSSIIIGDKEYNVFDVTFNEKGKISEITFIQKGANLKNLLNRQVTSNQDNENDESDDAENVTLGASSFAKQFSGSCADWAILNYKHQTELPSYLQVVYGNGAPAQPPGGEAPAKTAGKSGGNGENKAIPEQQLIPLDAPSNPVPQIQN